MKKQTKSDILMAVGMFLFVSNPFTSIIGLYLFSKGLDLYEGKM